MPKILLIDDDQNLIDTLKIIIETYLPGNTVVCASDGEQGLRMALEEVPDVILLDLVMPKIDGYDLCGILKTNDKTKYIPLIVITGITTDRTLKSRILDLGADGFLSKPFETYELTSMTRAMLRLKQVDDQLRGERDKLRQLVEEQSRKLDRSQERLELVYKSTNDGIWDWDLADGTVFYSDHWMEALGYFSGELPGTIDTLWSLIVKEDLEDFRKALTAYINGETLSFQIELRMKTRGGQQKWFLYRAQGVWDAEHRIQRLVGTQADITERKAYESRLQYSAHHDVLTGLPNRMLFRDRLYQALAHADRFTSLSAVLFMDLDNFKSVNDVYGHLVGDLLLQQVATRLLNCVRKVDTVARMGGDEFTVILAGVKDEKDVAEIAQRIVQDISEPYEAQGKKLEISTSIGISLYPRHGGDVENLIRFADAAMYRAKQAGGQQFMFYRADATTPGRSSDSIFDLTIEQLGLLEVPYQRVSDGIMAGIEYVFARLREGRLEPASPQDLESVDDLEWFITRYTELVAEKIAQSEDQPSTSLFISLPPRFFFHAEMMEVVKQAESWRGSREIILGIAENTIFQDFDYTSEVMHRLAERGFKLSVDDFGTGFFSLQYFRDLPLMMLRIHPRIIERITLDNREKEILRTLAQFGHSIDLTLFAKGVETEEQLAFLREIGCDFMQPPQA